MLQRVEVLRLVDQHVAEAPAHGVGPRGVLGELPRGHAEQVVEVDDAAPTLERLVGGERRGDALRRLAPTTAGRLGRADVAIGGGSPGRGPVGLGGDRGERHAAAANLGEQALGGR